MNAPSSTEAKRAPGPVAKPSRPLTAGRQFTVPTAREMSPAECESQRRLVRASLMAKPVYP